jgi:hypothetical protein
MQLSIRMRYLPDNLTWVISQLFGNSTYSSTVPHYVCQDCRERFKLQNHIEILQHDA